MRLKLFLASLALIGFCNFAFAEELTLEVLDVGQADGLLVQTAGKSVLIDAGEAKDQVLGYLQERGLSNLDLVVATHPHADHIGGMYAVVRDTNVKVFMDNGQPHTTVMYTQLMGLVEEKVLNKQMKYVTAKRGMRINMGSEAYFEVLMPDSVPISGSRSDINANTVVMKLVHGENCILFSGDTEEETEQALVLQGMGKCNIYKVAHHGSRHSSTEALLSMIQPEVALISVGLANKHGHPGAETLERFEKHGTKVYRTDLSGSLKLISDGKSWRVETQREELVITKININLAPKDVLKELPGTGDKTAEAIIAYRESRGGYKSLEEILDTPKVDRKRLEKILPFVTIEGGSITGLTEGQNRTSTVLGQYAQVAVASDDSRININTASAPEIAKMPGLNMQKAEAVVADRASKGAFASCKDIVRVKGIGQKTYEKLESVCTTQDNAVTSTESDGQPSPAVATVENVVKININTALPEVIATMPGLNLDRAAIIVAKRTSGVPYAACSEALAQLKDFDASQANAFLAVCSTQDEGAIYIDGRVNINVAPLEILKGMPGMSASKAEKVIEYRQTSGKFKSCAEITNVKGIGQKTYEKLASTCIAN